MHNPVISINKPNPLADPPPFQREKKKRERERERERKKREREEKEFSLGFLDRIFGVI